MNETQGTRDTEQQLSEAITAFADTIHPAANAYRTAQREWHRRERRRRMILATLIMVVFASATLIGLWVLNHSSVTAHPAFSGAGSAPVSTIAGSPSDRSWKPGGPLPDGGECAYPGNLHFPEC